MYVIKKFKLNSSDLRGDWKKMSDIISGDMSENADGLIFRDSGIDDNDNVVCILKWESAEKQETFEEGLKKKMEEKPEIMAEFSRIVNMSTVTKEKFNLV